MIPPTAPALLLAPVASLGLVLAGCPDCRALVGIDGAPGLAGALAAHHTACPAGDQVCPGCGCEAELYQRANGWRCGDCLGERLFDDLAGLPAPARHPVLAPAWPRHAEHQDAAEPEPVKRAVA